MIISQYDLCFALEEIRKLRISGHVQGNTGGFSLALSASKTHALSLLSVWPLGRHAAEYERKQRCGFAMSQAQGWTHHPPPMGILF